eukprot:gnl/MRDRNA2_/MRDRNA2_98012_c0_seq1.p1 gnl/MRDRNA2_/MRDRNA2_98012_c0~~gnl/MRDRNA2_/MRDRNA2_98012_c0_seq1.p1  ORF type:complete len:510 (+),score=99.12 gnl/MRDRNA2_/MRDRNA2_98012_c0_seq1:120-1532(+)
METFKGVLNCQWTPDKGRILVATKDFEPGELILVESPLYIVQEERQNPGYLRLEELCNDNPDDFDYEPMWYWCALKSLTKEQIKGAYGGGWTPNSEDTQQKMLLLHHEDESQERNPGKSSEIICRDLVPGVAESLIEALKQIWVLNCFDYTEEPQGFAMYWFTSFMSHSCCPNVATYYVGNNHALRARKHIAAGEEIHITYLTDERLLFSGHMRRWELWETKTFWCGCERCCSDLDLSRGFRCPKCWKGTVFAPCPGDGEAESEDPPEADLIGAVCGSCGKQVTAEEATNLETYEKSFKVILEDLQRRAHSSWNPITEEDAKECLDFVDACFAQHYQADAAWELLVDVYLARKERANALKLMRRRCHFHEVAYPGLNPTHAAMLKTLADELKSSKIMDGLAAKRTEDLHEAQYLCGKALHILRLLYGDEYEDVKECAQAQQELLQALEDDVPARKRRRLQGKQSSAKHVF